jgi:Uma2 family endonuclease
MNPAGPRHNDLVMFLTDWSYRVTDRAKIRITVQTGLELASHESCPEPDVMWLRANRYPNRHPNAADVKLAIEVSDSSLQFDLNDKAALYAEAGIVEVWIVDSQGQRIHALRNPSKGKFQDRFLVMAGDLLSPLEPCQAPLDVGDLFATD